MISFRGLWMVAVLTSCPAVAAAAPTDVPLKIVWQSTDDPSTDDSAYPMTAPSGDQRAFVLFDSPKGPAEIRALTPTPSDAIVLADLIGSGDSLAVGDSGWFVAGSVDRSYVFQELLNFDSPRRDMALAKVRLDGHIAWQTTWGGPGFQTAGSVTALPSGGALVAGRDGDTGVLWVVDEAGGTRWTRNLGLEVNAIAAMPDGRIAVLGLDGGKTGTGYKTDLALWILDDAAQVVSRTVVRPTLETHPYSGTLKASLAVADRAIIVASDWDTYPGVDMPPFEIARFDFSGKSGWVARPPAQRCFSNIYAAGDGTLVMTCEERHGEGDAPYFDLVRISPIDGSASVLRAPLPHCEVDRYWAHVSVAGSYEGQPLVVGVQPKADTNRFCVWVARVESTEP